MRLRREYLYRKSLEGKQREDYERKLRIKRALEGIVATLAFVRVWALAVQYLSVDIIDICYV
jgi:hypothetical protein